MDGKISLLGKEYQILETEQAELQQIDKALRAKIQDDQKLYTEEITLLNIVRAMEKIVLQIEALDKQYLQLSKGGRSSEQLQGILRQIAELTQKGTMMAYDAHEIRRHIKGLEANDVTLFNGIQTVFERFDRALARGHDVIQAIRITS